MIFIRDTQLQRSASIVLFLYAGAFLGQARCVLQRSHMEASMERSVGHAPSSMVKHAPLSTVANTATSVAAYHPSQPDERSSAPGENRSGACAVVACGSAVTAISQHGLEPMGRVSIAHLAYLGGMTPPDVEMVPPPPRLG